MDRPTDSSRTVYTVSELNGSVRLLLSTHYGAVWVEGEISNLTTPSSGHCYFSLKDFDAQVRCAIFRGSARGLGFRPQNGMRVLVHAQVSLYEPRGDYQLVVDFMEEAGDGALRRAFEALKQKLAGEGLFDQVRKKTLPLLPAAVGVITSPTGAAIRDILTVLKRRFPALPVIVYPVKVQGNDAKLEIARALGRADALGQCDVLILARGGGSLEDLWAFNEEVVARAIAACRVPVVSGVGHETDVTIADLVADVRAATPSAAAAAVCPDQAEWVGRFERLDRQLGLQMTQALRHRFQRLEFLHRRLIQAHPEKSLQRHGQRVDELELRLHRALQTLRATKASCLQTLSARLQRHHPNSSLHLAKSRFASLDHRLRMSALRSLERGSEKVARLGQALHGVSPLATLARGYSLTRRAADGRIVTKSSDTHPGELIETRLAEGSVTSRVECVTRGELGTEA